VSAEIAAARLNRAMSNWSEALIPSAWEKSHRADPKPRAVADNHYSRQKVGSIGFVPPGRCYVLYAENEIDAAQRAYWVTSWPFAEYVKHRWAGAWVCSAYRREGFPCDASQMIRQAVALTRGYYGDAPELGMITFVDRKKVRPTKVRGKDVWGWTFMKAGFEPDGETKGGLLALRLRPENMPLPRFC